MKDNPARKWLLERLLIPAGILPPLIKYQDLKYNQENRKQIGALGFEYMLLMDQDADKINSSAINGKIFSVHAPIPFFGHVSLGNNELINEIITKVVYGRVRIPRDFETVSEKTFSFAKKVGAKIAVFHTYHLNHNNIPQNLDLLARMEKEFGVTPVIEHEATYIETMLKTKSNEEDWVKKPDEMIKALDNFYPRKKFGICLDTSALYAYRLPILDTVKRVRDRVAHIHLSQSPVGLDIAGEIDRPELTDLVKYFYETNYSGYVLAEINGAIGILEGLEAQIYGASSIIGLPILKSVCVANAQRHIRKSCQFLLNNV